MPDLMTREDASRIQATQTKLGHDHGKGSWPARAQAAASRNEPQASHAPKTGGGGASKSGGGGGGRSGGGGGGGGGKSGGGHGRK